MNVPRLVDALHDDPTAALRLRRTGPGCDRLLELWGHLLEAIRRRGRWHHSQRNLALALLGRRPREVFDDPLVYDITRAFVAAGWGVRGPDPVRITGMIAGDEPRGLSSPTSSGTST